ncbi:MAG: hypothetical protein JXB50_03300 [Spirochaetes bacterium]|nr:hypothetical protein [Spirochaetota bacterium]
MKNSSQFDLLSKHLDEEERKQLLHKIKKEKNNNLIVEEDYSDNLSQSKTASVYEKQIRIAQNVYDNESLLVKIIIWIVSIFTGKKKEDVVLNKLFKELKKDIIIINDGIINFESDILTNFFINEINNLYDACNLVLPVIDKFFNDTIFYNSFLSFIFEKNFDDNLRNLINELNPENYNIDSSKIDKELYLDEKKKRINNFFKHLSLFPISGLNQKFVNFETFIRFVTFDFRTLIYYFMQDNNIDASQIKYGVKFSVVETLLEKLFIILNSINFNYNDIDFIEEMIEYSHLKSEEKIGNAELYFSEIDINNIKLIFDAIDNFYEKVPLLKIFQYFKKNLLYKPQTLNLKLNFLSTYKHHKRNKIDSDWEKYYEKLLDKNQTRLIKELFGEYNFHTLEHFSLKLMETINRNSHVKLKSVKKLNILTQFIEKIYKTEIEKIINKILIDGSFFKENYRNNLSSSYYILYNCKERIKEFDKDFDLDNDVGRKLMTYLRITTPDVDYTKTLQNTIIGINESSDELIKEIIQALNYINDFLANLLEPAKKENVILLDFENIKIPGFFNSHQAVTKIKKYFDLFFKIFKGIEDF